MIPLEDVKAHIVLEHAADDVLLQGYIDAAVTAVESKTGRIVKQRAETRYFDQFNASIEVVNPLVSVEAIRYVDPDGVEQTVPPTVYTVVTGLYGSIELAYGQQWPATRQQKQAVAIDFTAGWLEPELPKDVRLALLVLIATFYENRESLAAVQLYEVPMSYRFLIERIEKPQL